MNKTRTRTKGKLIDSDCTLWQENDSCAHLGMENVALQPLFMSGRTQVMTDEVVPGFRKHVEHGDVFFNPMSSTVTSVEFLAGSGGTREHKTKLSCYANGVTTLYARRYGASGPQWQVLYSVAIGQAITKGRVPPFRELIPASEISQRLAEKVTKLHNQRGRYDSNTWEAVAEIGKSVTMLRDILMDIKKLGSPKMWKDLGKYGHRREWAKKAADTYAMFRWGIMPLIQDAEAIRKGMAEAVGRVRKSTRTKGLVFKTESRTVTYTGDVIVSFLEQSTDMVNIRCVSLDEFDKTLANNLGFGAKGLITLPWELVSRSFVYDWFVNIGDFIGALVPAIGWKQLGSCYVIERILTTDVSCVATSGTTNYAVVTPYAGALQAIRVSKVRIPGLPSPSVVVKQSFGFDQLQRRVDALALAYQSVFGQMKARGRKRNRV